MIDRAENKNSSMESMSVSTASANRSKRNLTMAIVVGFLLFSAIASAIIWQLYFRYYEKTEDAYVNGYIILLSSRQDGSVSSWHAEESDYVKEGEVLVRLDPIDYQSQLDQKKAALALAARRVRELYEEMEQKRSKVRLETAKFELFRLNLEKLRSFPDGKKLAQEDIQQAEANFNVQKGSLDLAVHQLTAAEVFLGSAPLKNHPEIEKEKVGLTEAFLALSRCNIKSPVSGYIANKNVQVGEPIKRGTPLMYIVPLSPLWVDANFKETQLSNIRVGQPVTLTSEMYGRKVVFHGTIEGLLPGSGSTFSLLPTQNATGNWIKIIQRVPVRIALDQEEVKKSPLVLGLTMSVSVDISDTSGQQLAEKTVQQGAKTQIFEVNFDEIDALINKIITENIQLPPKTNESVKQD